MRKFSPTFFRQKAEERAVALVLVLGSITLLTLLFAELQDEASSEFAATLNDRDALQAEYAARSAVNLARLLIATEPTVRTAIGPLLGVMLGGGGAPQIPVWEFGDQILGIFNDPQGVSSFQGLTSVDLATGKNLGMKGVRFEISVIDEDSKLNINLAARGEAVMQQRLSLELLGLMQGPQYDPLFENRDTEGQYSTRPAICGALVDWADPDENRHGCDPRSAQNQDTGAEDSYYQTLKLPYRRKNAAYDSLEELHLVRGVSEEFYATFLDPDPGEPRRRPVTIWGQGTVNVNSANAQTLYAIVCGSADPATPLCIDPLLGQKFMAGLNLVRSFTTGVPVFTSPAAFVKALQGQGMFGGILKNMLGIEPIKLISTAELQKMVSTESKVFSIYTEGIVKGFRRETRVRIHAVVDFRNNAAPGAAASITGAGGARTTTPTPSSSAGALSALSTLASAAAGSAPNNGGGTVVYYRIE